ncbi:MAG: ABC transporter ATP-binding protein [Sulfobacillus sp.]
MAIVSANNVTKIFSRRTRLFRRGNEDSVTAIDRLTLTIDQGEFLGLLGPNGAGKSTLIKMLTGILHPTSGDIQVAGWSAQHQRARLAMDLGIVFGQRTQLWWDLPLHESFAILRRMYRVSEDAYRTRLAELTALLDLREFWNVPVRQLSLGQRMRGELAAALLHAPTLLFLDEPTIGLDVEAKAAVRQFLRTLNQEKGTTIVLTTHDMNDVEELCRRIVIINHGRSVFDGTMEALHQRVGMPSRLVVTFNHSVEQLTNLPSDCQAYGNQITASFNRARQSPLAVIDGLRQWGEIIDIQMQEPPLDLVMRGLYQSVR